MNSPAASEAQRLRSRNAPSLIKHNMQIEEIYRRLPEQAKVLLRSALAPQGPAQGRIIVRPREDTYSFIAGNRETSVPLVSKQFQELAAAWNCLEGLRLVESVAMGTYRLTDLGYRVASHTPRED